METLDGFKKTTPTSRKGAAKVETPVAQPVQEAQPAQEPVTTTKEEPKTYQDRLAAEGIQLEDALLIVDEMVRNDRYTETFNLSKSLEVTISTRDMRFTNYLNKLLDKVEVERFSLYTQMSSMNQVAASLVSYGKESLPKFDPKMDEASWTSVMDTRIKFVEQLAGPVFLAILNRLSKFDRKLAVVFSEGYDENF